MTNNQHGLLLLDKPAELTSHTCVQRVRRLLNIKKAGHVGVLDPMATGLLPICCGKATRLAEFLQQADKSYHATFRLGIQTDSADAQGKVINESPPPQVTQQQLDDISARLTGRITQTPPVFSAIKRNGKPMYYWARKAHTDTLPAMASRQITIYSLRITANNNWEHQYDLQVTCSKGTYIRTLAEQIAEYLHTCAHLTQLRRTTCASYSVADAVQLSVLKTQPCIATAWINMIDMLPQLPRVELTGENVKKICCGMTIVHTEQDVCGNMLAVTSDRVLALVRSDKGTLTPIKVFYP